MYSIRMISFFTSRPISRIAPMNDETFSGVPVIQSANRALDQGDGLHKEEPDRQDHASELKSHQEEHQRRRHDQDRQEAGERLLLCSVAPRQLPAVSRRELHIGKLCPELAVDRAEVAAFQLGAHGDNGLLVFTPQLVGTANRTDRRQLAKRNEANPGGCREARAAGRGGCRSQADWQQGQMFAIVPDPIRVANANLRQPVLFRDCARDLAVKRGVELRLDVHLGQADAGGLDAVGPDDDVGIAEIDVRIDVGRAWVPPPPPCRLSRPACGGWRNRGRRP